MKYYIIGVIIGLILIFTLEYLIAISSLPDWFKFALLR